jgi:hypothetical protein
MRGLNTELGHKVGSRSGLIRGPNNHQLSDEFFPVRGFSRLAGYSEDAGVEDCIQQHHSSRVSGSSLRDEARKGGSSVIPECSTVS